MLALIMAGGYGKRLRPLTYTMPKSLIKVGGKPVIYWQIKWLEAKGVDKFVLLGGYKAHMLVSYIKSIGYNKYFSFSTEKKPLGTAGAIKNASPLIDDEESFFVINGDNVTDIDISKLRLYNHDVCAISLVPYRSEKGIVESSRYRVVGFEEKPLIEGYWFNAGVTLASVSLLDILPKSGSLEQDIFPRLVKSRQLSCFKFRDIYFNSIDSFKDIEVIDKDLKSGKANIS